VAPSSNSPARVASQRTVLLLESYDALAAAIGSALKKFAPEHKIDIVASLSDAETRAAQNAPELFVIDADPPWPGITDFLEKMREKNPDARALVIGAKLPDEIAAERKFSGALQFIEKPFDLPAFGAAVQALLGPWRETVSTGSCGNLGQLSAIDVLLLHHAAEANVIVDLSAGPNFAGEIHVAAGQVSHAATANLVGLEALREILSWADARMSERKVVVELHRGTRRGWIEMVFEALRSRAAIKPQVVGSTESRPTDKKTGKKIVVIDDTEMLLVFVEDALTIADPELQIATARTGNEGLKKIHEIAPDLVLLDYNLPDLNGDKVCLRLLEDEQTAAIPVLMMSAHGPEMMAAAKRLSNVVAAIEKPFFSKQLVDLLQRTLSQRRAARPPARTVRAALAEQRGVSTTPQPQSAPPREVRGNIPPRIADATAPTAKAAPSPPPRQVQRNVPLKTADTVVIKPPPPPILQPPKVATKAPETAEIRVPAAVTETVLSLYLEVVSMQFTPHFEMGSIRARPPSGSVSLRLRTAAVQAAVTREAGFQLGATELDANGRISMMRLVPNSKPFQPAQIQTAFQIGSVAVVPGGTRQRVQLTTAGSTPMMLQVIARPELAGVKLSPTFQVAELVLKWRTNAVRVTLDPKAPEESGAVFELGAVQLDNSARIVELLLNPVR